MNLPANIVFHLVDDNDIDIAVNTKLLQLSQISNNILTYNNALSFLATLKKSSPDFVAEHQIVLLDIMMPVMNGFECLDELSKPEYAAYSNLKVFMLSSSIDRNDIRKAESYPIVQKVLEKPLDVYLLKKFLEDIFA